MNRQLKFLILVLFLAIGVSGTFFSSKVFRNKSNVLRFKKPNLKKQVNDDGFKTQYFTQKLDHFNFQSNGENTYEQRYLINSKCLTLFYYKELFLH